MNNRAEHDKRAKEWSTKHGWTLRKYENEYLRMDILIIKKIINFWIRKASKSSKRNQIDFSFVFGIVQRFINYTKEDGTGNEHFSFENGKLVKEWTCERAQKEKEITSSIRPGMGASEPY